jgi:hypothetical protein
MYEAEEALDRTTIHIHVNSRSRLEMFENADDSLTGNAVQGTQTVNQKRCGPDEALIPRKIALV